MHAINGNDKFVGFWYKMNCIINIVFQSASFYWPDKLIL